MCPFAKNGIIIAEVSRQGKEDAAYLAGVNPSDKSDRSDFVGLVGLVESR